MATHMIDYMRWYLGEPEAQWVMAQAAGRGKLKDNHPSPDYLAGVIQFAGGAHGWLEVGAGAPDQPEVAKWWGKNRIGVQGAEGFAEVLTNGGWRAVTRDGVRGGDGAMNYDLDMPPYIQDMAAWLDDDRAAHPCSFAQAWKGFEIAMALYRSVIEGGQVALPLADGMDELAALAKKLPEKKALLGFEGSAGEYGQRG
jgi:predicted dehydrogenase